MRDRDNKTLIIKSLLPIKSQPNVAARTCVRKVIPLISQCGLRVHTIYNLETKASYRLCKRKANDTFGFFRNHYFCV